MQMCAGRFLLYRPPSPTLMCIFVCIYIYIRISCTYIQIDICTYAWSWIRFIRCVARWDGAERPAVASAVYFWSWRRRDEMEVKLSGSWFDLDIILDRCVYILQCGWNYEFLYGGGFGCLFIDENRIFDKHYSQNYVSIIRKLPRI